MKLDDKESSGGHSKEVTPVPISNTEVKLLSVDGTAWEAVWESRELPDTKLKSPFSIYLLKGLFAFRDLIFYEKDDFLIIGS